MKRSLPTNLYVVFASLGGLFFATLYPSQVLTYNYTLLGFVRIFLAMTTLLILPGYVLLRNKTVSQLIPTKIPCKHLSIIPISFIFWILFDQLYFSLTGVFDQYTLVIGVALLLLLEVLQTHKGWVAKLPKLQLSRTESKAYLIALLVITATLTTAYFGQDYFPINYDTQTHSTLTHNILLQETAQSKTIWLNGQAEHNNYNYTFYPLGFHTVASQWIRITNFAPLPSMMQLLTPMILLIPALIAYALSQYTKASSKLPTIAMLLAPIFYFFPYGVLEWGGLALYGSIFLMIWAVGSYKWLLDKYKLASLSSNLLLGLILLAIFLLHPTTAFTLVLFALPLLYTAIREGKIKDYRVVLSGLLIGVIFTTLLLLPLIGDLGTFFNTHIVERTQRSYPGEDEDFFSIVNFLGAYPASFGRWFLYGPILLLVPFFIGALDLLDRIWTAFKSRKWDKNLWHLLIPFIILTLLVGFARGSSNIPIINNITAIYYHSFRRTAYFLHIPLLYITALGTGNLLSYLKIKKVNKAVINTALLVIYISSFYLLIAKVRTDVREKGFHPSTQAAILALRDEPAGEVVQLPTYYSVNRESDLNWISGIDPNHVPLMDRTIISMVKEERQARLALANDIFAEPKTLCQEMPFNVRYVYSSSVPYRYHEEVFDITQKELHRETKARLAQVDCLTLLFEDEMVSLYRVD